MLRRRRRSLKGLPLLQQPGDPIPFGPTTWEFKQWLGLGIYLLLFLLFVFLVYRLARPEVDSETQSPPAQPPSDTGGQG